MIVTTAAVRHRTTVFVLMALIALAGAYAFTALPRESAPDIKIPYMNVITVYPGVAPGDVETLLTIPIESELKNLRDVEHVMSVSAEGASVITIQFKPDVDLDIALQRVKEKVDTARQELPEEAEEPQVEEISTSDFPIMQVNVTGGVGLVRLKQIAEDLQDRIEGIRGVLRAQLVGGREREIRVEFDPERLAAYRLSPQEVAQTIKGANVNIPGGSLELGEANYLLRVPGEFADPAEIGGLVVARREGRAVYARDVARVVDGFKEDETISRFNGVPSVSLSIQKRAGENIIRICDEVRVILGDERARLPPGVSISVAYDESRVIARMLTDLNNNMINGLVLVIVVLFFTMGLLSSIFVALAIPFSMLITLAVLHALGYTLNIIVLFSLVLVLGMLVDNAIVIVENIYRHQEEGEEPVQAALRGTAEVAWPVVASSATNIAPFLPMLFWPGIMGEFMSYLPKTVITGLLASLFVALVINPTLCAAFMRVDPKRRAGAGSRADSGFMRAYEWILAFSIDHYRASIAAVFTALALLVALYGFFGKGLIFFPDIEPDRGSVNIKAPRGTALATTDALARQAEETARCCDNVDFVIADVGTGGRGVFVGGGSTRSDAARISVNFKEYEKRTEPASGTLARIRDGVLKVIVGAEVEVAKEEHGPPTGAPVNIEVSGEDFETIVRLAARVKEQIRRVPGVVDLRDDYDQGQPEIRVLLDKERAALHGVSAAEIAGTIRAAVSGVEAGVFREGDKEYDITVRLPREERRRLDALGHMTIPDRLGNQVPLSTFARLEIGAGLGSIRRKDNKRVVTVSGEVQGRLADDVRREAQAAVAAISLPPRTGIAFTGEYEEQEKNQAFLGKAFLIGVLLIALVLVTEFNSLTISFIILFTVVLSLMGVIIGLLVTGFPFGVIMTGIGVISLGGIVVNNAIVLLDFIQNLRAGGMPIRAALIHAGKIRLRPVTLGAISTVVGLVPVALGIDIDFVNLRVVLGSESSQWWESLAVAIIFGATVATALTLVMVPTFYRAFFGRSEASGARAATGGTDHA